MNISEFRSVINLKGGLQKTNKWKLTFPMPPTMQGATFMNGTSSLDTNRYIEYMCNVAQMPGVGLATRPITRYGYGVSEKKPAFSVFNDITLSFYNDAASNILEFFQMWMFTINNFDFSTTINGVNVINNKPTSVYELSYKEEYAVDAELTLYGVGADPNNGQSAQPQARYKMLLRDFFPVGIPETALQWEPSQTPMQLVVLFSFTDWTIQTPSGLDSPRSELGQFSLVDAAHTLQQGPQTVSA